MRTWMLGLGLAVVLVGCTPYRPKTAGELPPVPPAHPVPHVAVVRFAVAQRAGGAPVPPAVGTEIANRLAHRLARAGVAVVDPEIVLRLAARGAQEDRVVAAIRVAREVGANRVVFGTVTRYRDGDAPSLAYEAVLVRALDGLVLATDRFDDAARGGAVKGLLRGGGDLVDHALDATAARFAGALDRRPAPRGRSGAR